MRIAYLGPDGSFSSMAARRVFPVGELCARATIGAVLSAYEAGDCDFAVLPIENAIEGTVNQSLDALYAADESVVTRLEVILPIRQQLLVSPGTRAADLRQILSHPHALAQVRDFLQAHFPMAEILFSDSTSSAAKAVASRKDRALAAVASRAAAERFGLEILSADIADYPDNFTRFWVLGRERAVAARPGNLHKLSYALTLPNNEAGILQKALSVFAWRGISLTKLESRPLKTVLGEYFFLVDLLADKKMPYALEELASLGVTAKLLGDYEVIH